jgi:hypothetical protein
VPLLYVFSVLFAVIHNRCKAAARPIIDKKQYYPKLIIIFPPHVIVREIKRVVCGKTGLLRLLLSTSLATDIQRYFITPDSLKSLQGDPKNMEDVSKLEPVRL